MVYHSKLLQTELGLPSSITNYSKPGKGKKIWVLHLLAKLPMRLENLLKKYEPKNARGFAVRHKKGALQPQGTLSANLPGVDGFGCCAGFASNAYG